MENVKITSFEIENVKRVRAVSLEPAQEGLTVIGGRNCQGKTSVLDAIAYALGGEKRRPSNFQNEEGMNPGSIKVTLSNGLIVQRAGKNAALKVTDPSGSKAGQKLLDSFIEELALDLPKFMIMDSRKKAQVLLHCLGIEEQLDALDKEEKKAYDERTLQNREADRKEKYAKELPEFPDAPDEPLDAAQLMKELQDIALNNERVANHQMALKNAREAAEYSHQVVEKVKADLQTAEEREKKAMAELSQLESLQLLERDPADAQAALDNLNETNRRVQANNDKHVAIDVAKEARELADILTRKVEEVRERRMALLKSANMPLEGLSVEDGELVYNGQKWDCMSSMEQFRVAVAVCRQLKPECGFVLLDKLEAFDLGQLREFNEWLQTMGMQAIATRVSEGDECSIIITDGMVSDDDHAEEELADKLQDEEKDDNEIGGF